jgi:hypothetical protein
MIIRLLMLLYYVRQTIEYAVDRKCQYLHPPNNIGILHQLPVQNGISSFRVTSYGGNEALPLFDTFLFLHITDKRNFKKK